MKRHNNTIILGSNPTEIHTSTILPEFASIPTNQPEKHTHLPKRQVRNYNGPPYLQKLISVLRPPSLVVRLRNRRIARRLGGLSFRDAGPATTARSRIHSRATYIFVYPPRPPSPSSCTFATAGAASTHQRSGSMPVLP